MEYNGTVMLMTPNYTILSTCTSCTPLVALWAWNQTLPRSQRVCITTYIHRISQIWTSFKSECMFKSDQHSFVNSRFRDFLNALLSNLPAADSTLVPLQQAHNSTARLLCGVGRCEHITSVLQKLHWLSVKKRSVYKILGLTYKALYGLSAPSYMSESLIQYRPSRNLRSASLPLQL